MGAGLRESVRDAKYVTISPISPGEQQRAGRGSMHSKRRGAITSRAPEREREKKHIFQNLIRWERPRGGGAAAGRRQREKNSVPSTRQRGCYYA
jgi:hypothetical protein